MQTKKILKTVLLWSLITLLVSMFLGLGWPLYQNARRQAIERELVGLLKTIHSQLDNYYQQNDRFYPDGITKSEITRLWDIPVMKDFVLQYVPDGDDAFEIEAQWVKPGTAFERYEFMLYMNEKPFDLKSNPPNPCCASFGQCPSLPKCDFRSTP